MPKLNTFRLRGHFVLLHCFLFSVAWSTSSFSQSLYINELMASNSSTDYDDFFEFEDWIEIYNAGGLINLAGYYLSDNPDSLQMWMIPSTNPGITTMLPGGFLRFWCDNDPQQGEDHSTFKLSGDGEFVMLVKPDGVTIVDSISFGIQQSDVSFGRTCDGCAAWQYFNVPTPEATNQEINVPPSQLYINEFQSANANTIFDESFEFEPWIEIFNPNDFMVNLSGYTLETNSSVYTINNNQPFLTAIEPNDFVVLWLDGEVENGSNHVNLDLNGIDFISLKGNNGSVIDQIEWNASLGTDVSLGRVLDGSTSWIEFNIPTPRVTNSLQIVPPTPLVINEAQADNFITIQDGAGDFEDWIEIHNPTSQAIDIAGYYFTDRMDRPKKWQVPTGIPDSTVIAPGGFLLLFADEEGAEGWNHMNFKLSSLGEHLAFRSPDGFSVVDSTNIPSVDMDQSWGRQFDASLPWVYFTVPTPGASNGVAGDDSKINGFEDWKVYPNPIHRSQPFYASHAGTLFNVHGQLLDSWKSPQWIHLQLEIGMYFIRFDDHSDYARQQAVKLLVK